ncbi:hypothetical protein BGZ59_002434, partial [Podila verticillata]
MLLRNWTVLFTLGSLVAAFPISSADKLEIKPYIPDVKPYVAEVRLNEPGPIYQDDYEPEYDGSYNDKP